MTDLTAQVNLYLGDCRDILPTLETGSVDAVITDPPYGVGFRYSNGKEKANDPGTYWDFLKPIRDKWLRILRAGGFEAVWQAHLNLRYAWEWFGPEIVIYAACKNFCQLRKNPFQLNSYDPVVMQYKNGADPLYPERPPRSLMHFTANTAGIISDTTRIEKAHPCPRPLDAVIEIVKNFSLPSGIVLDPFMGSGTTGVA